MVVQKNLRNRDKNKGGDLEVWHFGLVKPLLSIIIKSLYMTNTMYVVFYLIEKSSKKVKAEKNLIKISYNTKKN